MKQVSCIISIFCAVFNSCAAQEHRNDPYFSAGPGLGRHAIVENDTLFNDRMFSIDLNYGQSLDGRTDEWISFTHAKYIQYNFIYIDLSKLKGSEDTIRDGLGHHFGLDAALQIQLFRTKSFASYVFPGIGLSWLSQTYFTNYQNRFIGSHLNYLIRVELGLQYKPAAKWAVSAGGRFLHFSNGGFSIPNAGVNLVGATIGLNYFLHAK